MGISARKMHLYVLNHDINYIIENSIPITNWTNIYLNNFYKNIIYSNPFGVVFIILFADNSIYLYYQKLKLLKTDRSNKYFVVGRIQLFLL